MAVPVVAVVSLVPFHSEVARVYRVKVSRVGHLAPRGTLAVAAAVALAPPVWTGLQAWAVMVVSASRVPLRVPHSSMAVAAVLESIAVGLLLGWVEQAAVATVAYTVARPLQATQTRAAVVAETVITPEVLAVTEAMG